MKTKTRWGIIGCGQIAIEKMLPAMLASPQVELIAVADPLPERRALAPVHGYEDAAQLLSDDRIDAVYIALPTALHLSGVIAAAQAKKAILCEKPLGQSVDEVQQMVATAEREGVPLMTAYMSRFGDAYQQACRAIRDGEIGSVRFVDANFSYNALRAYPTGSAGGWRWTDPLGGGPLLDIGVYLAFALRELLQDPIVHISAHALHTVAPEGAAVADSNIAWFETARGVPGVFAATFTHDECRITVYGDEGNVELSDCFAQQPTGRLVCTVGGLQRVVDASPELPHFEHYRREVEHFSAAIQTGAPFSPSPADALADAVLLSNLKGVRP